jgi:DNA-binding transcriptional ArsR family regulator
MALPSEAEILEFPEEMVENARRAADTLKALGHESRLLILCLLAEGEKPVTELEKLLAMKQPAVSQQLARLRADNLVQTRREGKAIYYSIATHEVREIIRVLYDLYCGDAKDCAPSQ